MKVVVILGPPGIGKTTLLTALGNHLGCPHLELSIVPEFRRIAGEAIGYEQDERIAIENLVLWAGNYLRHGHRLVLLGDFRLEALPILRETLAAFATLPMVLTTSDPQVLAQRVGRRTTGFRDVTVTLAANQAWRALAWPGKHDIDIAGRSTQDLVVEAKAAIDLATTRDTSAPGTLAIHVRQMASEDPPLLAAAFAPKSFEQYAHYLREHTAGRRNVVLPFFGTRLVGYLTINWNPDYAPLAAAGIPEVQDLNVVEEFRRRGIASRLMDEAEAIVAERNDRVGIGVGLHPGYNAAQRMYALRGYVPDANGITFGNTFVREGQTVVVDDDLMLHLVKIFRAAPGSG